MMKIPPRLSSDIPSAKLIWTIRFVVFGLFAIWLAGAIYLHHEVKVSRAKVEQSRIEKARRQEILRRGAQYQQELKKFGQGSRSRNVFDGR